MEDRIGHVLPRSIEREMRESYIDFAMSVITSRALPDVRDGLKPVQRRVLYAMDELSLRPTSPHKKSARIVGEVLGKYHPHSDAPVYDTMVRLAQTFSMRYPLVDGQGNFGSVDGDPPAAMRYCVTGDTLAVTGHGLERVDQLSPQGGEDVALRVLSMDGKVHAASKWFDCGVFPTRRVTTRRGYEVTGTLNHPLLVCIPGNDGRAKLVWKTIDRIAPADWVVLDRGDGFWPTEAVDLRGLSQSSLAGSRATEHELPSHLDADLAFVLGALTAEGTFRASVVEFTNTLGPFADAFRGAWQRAFPTCRLHAFLREPTGYGRKQFWQLQIVSQHVIGFLDVLGLRGKSATRKVPQVVLSSPRAVAAAFLRGLYEGDGAVERSGRSVLRVSLCSKSRAMLSQVQTLLLRFGIVATLNDEPARGTSRLLILGRENLQRFADDIGFVSEAKRSALARALSLHTSRALPKTDFVPFVSDFVRANATRGQREWLSRHNIDRPVRLIAALPRLAQVLPPADIVDLERLDSGRYLFEQVASVENAGDQRVYSIRVDSSCHSFVANGFINHNTEARLSAIAEELLVDIDKNTVDFQPNFDGSLREPSVLPAKLPNLLVNGSVGIAVGMATNIPPHNLTEVIDAVVLMIGRYGTAVEAGVPFGLAWSRIMRATTDPEAVQAALQGLPKALAAEVRRAAEQVSKPPSEHELGDALLAHVDSLIDVTPDELMQHVKGPDFPTAGFIVGDEGIKSAYTTGHGRIVIRAKVHTEDLKGNRESIVVTELPYQVNKATLVEKIADLVKDKRIDGISDLRDESDRQGMRLVVELKRDTNARSVMNQLFKMTSMQSAFSINMLALVDGAPRILTLKQILLQYLSWRHQVLTRRTVFEVEKARARAHILEGLKVALDNLDEVVRIIRGARDTEAARTGLMTRFGLSEVQATAILDMQLRRLAALERQKILDELKDVLGLVARLEDLLANPVKILFLARDELIQLKEKFGDERRSKILYDASSELTAEDLVPDQDVVVLSTVRDYVRRLPGDAFRVRRSIRGVSTTISQEEDAIRHLSIANTRDTVVFFTNKGKMYAVKAHELPEQQARARGLPLTNLTGITREEKVSAVVAIKGFEQAGYFIFVTRGGEVKKTATKDYASCRANGLIAMDLPPGDELVWVGYSPGNAEISIITEQGQSIRFKDAMLRAASRQSGGVRGIKLAPKDQVVDANIVEPDGDVLLVTARGFGKRVPISQFTVQGRGGGGIRVMPVSARTGDVVVARIVRSGDEVMLASREGVVVRQAIVTVPPISRSAQGAVIIQLGPKDSVAAMARLRATPEDGGGEGATPPSTPPEGDDPSGSDRPRVDGPSANGNGPTDRAPSPNGSGRRPIARAAAPVSTGAQPLTRGKTAALAPAARDKVPSPAAAPVARVPSGTAVQPARAPARAGKAVAATTATATFAPPLRVSAAPTKPAASATSSAVSVTKPAALVTKPAGAATKPAALATKPAALATKPTALATKPTALATKPVVATPKPPAPNSMPAAVASKPAARATSRSARPGRAPRPPASSSGVSAPDPNRLATRAARPRQGTQAAPVQPQLAGWRPLERDESSSSTPRPQAVVPSSPAPRSPGSRRAENVVQGALPLVRSSSGGKPRKAPPRAR